MIPALFFIYCTLNYANAEWDKVKETAKTAATSGLILSQEHGGAAENMFSGYSEIRNT